MTQTVPDISPLMPMHQDPLLGYSEVTKTSDIIKQYACYIILEENAVCVSPRPGECYASVYPTTVTRLSTHWHITRCACLLDSGGTIWLLSVYRDPVGIKIDSVGTSRRKWPVPKPFRLIYPHILMSMRLKGGKLLPPSNDDNTCVARKCIPYFFCIYFEYLCAYTKLRVW